MDRLRALLPKMLKWLGVLVVIYLLVCWVDSGLPVPGRYGLVNVDGRAMRIDQWTGTTWVLRGYSWLQVPEP